MTWPVLATVLICSVVMAGAFVSVLETVLFHSDSLSRNMGCFSEMKLDCRGIPARKWAGALRHADGMWRGEKVPVRAFAFADYVDARELSCEGGSCIDYGVALGYAGKDRKTVSYQLSYVLHSEKTRGADHGNSAAKSREKTLWGLTRMLTLLEERDPAFAGMTVDAPFIAHKAEKFFPSEEDFLAACWVPRPSETVSNAGGELRGNYEVPEPEDDRDHPGCEKDTSDSDVAGEIL